MVGSQEAQERNSFCAVMSGVSCALNKRNNIDKAQMSTRIICHSALAILSCMLLYACNSLPTGTKEKITLTPLDKKSDTDTMEVSASLPLMNQQKESLYKIKDHSSMMEMNVIYTDTILAPEYRIIPLETTEECVVGEISNLFVDDNLIFLVDTWSERISVFDMNGKFQNHIGRKGHAKGEYVSMFSVTLDTRQKRVCFIDEDSQKLLFYDYKGNFLSQEPRYFWYQNIAFLRSDKRVLLTLPYDHKDYQALNSFKLTITDEEGVPLCGALENPGFPKGEIDNRPFRCSLENPLHANPDGVYYMDILSPDTIWKIKDEECVPFVSLDFGEPFTTPQTYREMTKENYDERINQTKALWDNFAFSKDFGYLYYDNCAIIDLNTGKYMTGRLSRRGRRPTPNFLEYSFETRPNEKFFLFDWEKNQFAKVWPANEAVRMLSMMRQNPEWVKIYQAWPQSDRDILDRLTPEDNPVIVVGTFKKF